jgi:hypothetical protein
VKPDAVHATVGERRLWLRTVKELSTLVPEPERQEFLRRCDLSAQTLFG